MRQGTRTGKRCERREKEGKKASERRANERKESEGREGRWRKEAEGERKQQRKMVALETARPHQNLRSDADGRDEMRYYPT